MSGLVSPRGPGDTAQDDQPQSPWSEGPRLLCPCWLTFALSPSKGQGGVRAASLTQVSIWHSLLGSSLEVQCPPVVSSASGPVGAEYMSGVQFEVDLCLQAQRRDLAFLSYRRTVIGSPGAYEPSLR